MSSGQLAALATSQVDEVNAEDAPKERLTTPQDAHFGFRPSVTPSAAGCLDEVIAHRLVKAHKAARRRRLRVSGASIALGSILTFVGLALLFTFTNIVGTFAVIFILLGVFLFANAILPSDTRAIRVAVTFAFLLTVAISGYAALAVFSGPESLIGAPEPCGNSTTIMNYCIAQNAQYYIDFSTFVTSSVALAWTSRLTRDSHGKWRPALFPRVALNRLWIVALVTCLSSGIGWAASTLGRLPYRDPENEDARNYLGSQTILQQFVTAFAFLLFSFCSTPLVRKQMQRILAGSGAAAAEASAAASVSAVIGGGDVDSALEAATATFRCISFEQLAETDFGSNATSIELETRARAAALGEIDSFLSHSWRDDKAEKWNLLTKYSEGFREHHHGRQPLLWLDKACLNQEDVAGSLSHLPVHMAGCQSLLVVAGPTYTSRLWCDRAQSNPARTPHNHREWHKVRSDSAPLPSQRTLLELYVWLAMGKDMQRIKLHTFGSADVMKSFKSVNVRDAACHSAGNKQKILSIIESSFTSLNAFDKHVQRVLLDCSHLQETGTHHHLPNLHLQLSKKSIAGSRKALFRTRQKSSETVKTAMTSGTATTLSTKQQDAIRPVEV